MREIRLVFILGKKSSSSHPTKDDTIHLKGIAIGNGWTDPASVYLSYRKFATQHGLIPERLNGAFDRMEDNCKKALNVSSDLLEVAACEDILSTILLDSTSGDKMCINMYDVRLRDDDADGGCGLYSWPKSLPATIKYLDVRPCWFCGVTITDVSLTSRLSQQAARRCGGDPRETGHEVARVQR